MNYIDDEIQPDLTWPLNGKRKHRTLGSQNSPTFDIPNISIEEYRLLEAWIQRWVNLWNQHPNGRQSDIRCTLMGTDQGGIEVSLLIAELRPSVRIVVKAGAVSSAIERALQLGLSAIASPFIFHTIPEDPLYTYSDKVIVLDEGEWDPMANAFLYLSTETALAGNLWAFELLNREYEFGITLGYPACCCASYCSGENTSIRRAMIIEQSHLLNIEAQVFGYQIISHTPCSPSCEKSLLMATKWASYLQAQSNQNFQYLSEILKSAVLRFENGERLFFVNAIREGDTLVCFKPDDVLSFGPHARMSANLLRSMNRPFRVIMRTNHICQIEDGICLPNGPHQMIFNTASPENI